MELPLIFDIKRHATEDGPGIRTTVFFKGCNLSCVWCHNPEAIAPSAEIAFYPARCIACGECVRVCPENACNLSNPRRIERAKCTGCGDCVNACPGWGLMMVGRKYSVDELISILLRDMVYYEVSGGGITFSGGEPTLYRGYLSSVLRRLKEKGIHTAIQTNGYFPWSGFKAELLDYVDLIMLDLKLVDTGEHLKYTGKPNQIIFENLERLLRQEKVRVIPRIPLIPQITATHHNLERLRSVLQKLRTRCLVLPYNPLGIPKWEAIGKQMPYDLPQHMMDIAEERRCKEILGEYSN